MAQFNDGDTYLSIRDLLNDTGLRKNNFSASTSPTGNDDQADGYEIGSLWLDVNTDKLFFATDVTNNFAVWKEVDIAGSYTDADVQAYLDAQGYSNVDLDAQTLSWDSVNGNLSITNGNTITLTGLDVQDISWDQANSNLSITGGSTITLTGLDTQSLSWDQANANLSISGGNTVTLHDQSLNTTSEPTFANITATSSVTANTVVALETVRLASLTTTQRDGLTAANGDMIYNVTDSKLQGYQAGAWINLDGTV